VLRPGLGEILYREAALAGAGGAADFAPAWAKLRLVEAMNDGQVKDLEVPEDDDESGATKNVFKLANNAKGLGYDDRALGLDAAGAARARSVAAG
jgi:hypothetical protein